MTAFAQKFLRFVFVLTLPFSAASAQMAAFAVSERDLGRPPHPPYISMLGIGATGKLKTDPSLPPKGPVTEVLFQEIRPSASAAGPAGEVMKEVKTKYDEQGRAAVEEDNNNLESRSSLVSSMTERGW